MKHLGDKGEFFVQKTLVTKGVECTINQDRATRYDYDLLCKVKDLDFTCEVKYDLRAEQTGNIAMEVHNSKADKPSGINVTKANLWIIVLCDENNGMQAHACQVNTLKAWMDSNKPARVVKFGGDKNAVLHLYPKDQILSQFTRLETLSEAELAEWLITTITS